MKRNICLLLIALALLLSACQEPAAAPSVVIVEVTASPTPELTPTPVPTETPEPTPIVVFAIGGDSRGSVGSEDGGDDPERKYLNKEALTRCFTAISGTDAEFMVYTGDFTLGDAHNDGQAVQYEAWMKAATAILPESFFYPVLGNHERQSEDLEGMLLFGDVFDEFVPTEFFDPAVYDRTNYVVTIGDCNLFILNGDFYANRGFIGDDVLAWVREKATPTGYNLFFVHKPCYPIGKHIGASMDLHPEQRDKLWQLIDELPGTCYFNAHEHMYNRREVDQSFNSAYTHTEYQVTAAGMGAPYHKIVEDDRGVVVGPIYVWHYIIATVWDDRAEFSVVDVDGNIIDSFVVYPGV